MFLVVYILLNNKQKKYKKFVISLIHKNKNQINLILKKNQNKYEFFFIHIIQVLKLIKRKKKIFIIK